MSNTTESTWRTYDANGSADLEADLDVLAGPALDVLSSAGL